MKRRQATLRYCSGCRCTTRHSEEQTTSTCTRCGTVKLVTRIVRLPQRPESELTPLPNE